MQIGVDSFAAAIPNDGNGARVSDSESIRHLVDRIELADQAGLDVFGVGEHHRREYLDSAPALILAAAAARTKNIRLTSAVTVLSAADPVRVFQNFATLDLLSQGRAEMVVGRGSFTESFPLFGLKLEDYDSLFAEKLDLLLKLRENEFVHWSGQHRASLTGQGVYPRPLQNPLPIWVGVGGTPESFARAGMRGLPLMIAIIGGETRRFRPLVDVYIANMAGARGTLRKNSKSASMPWVASPKQHSRQLTIFFRVTPKLSPKSAAERDVGRRLHVLHLFDAVRGEHGALLLGNPEEVAEKIRRHWPKRWAAFRGSLSRWSSAELSQAKLG